MQLKKWQGRLINKEELHVSKVNHFLLGFPGPGSKAPQIAALLVVSPKPANYTYQPYSFFVIYLQFVKGQTIFIFRLCPGTS